VTLAQYMRIIRQQWLVVLVLTAVCVGLAAAYTLTRTPQYSASTQMFVKVRDANASITQLTQGSDFTQARVKSYADVVTAPYVLDRVIQELGLSTTPSRLADNVAVEIPPDTVLINVTVRDPSPAQAAKIANAISAAFPSFVSELETPSGAEARSPVTVAVTAPATAPTVPISPRKSLNLVLGLLLGLGLGVGAAILRKQSNTSVSTVADVERITGSIPLGVVPFDSNTSKQPLVDADQHGPRAEAFRTLRTNLQFADVDNPPKVLVVTSAMPSEGKSTSACNVALTLAASGSRVVLVDGDLRMPTVGRYLGIDGGAGLTSVLAGQHDLRDVLVTYGRDHLTVLPSGPKPPNPSELLGSKQMMDLLTSLANHFDIVVIDAPPLLPVTDAAILSAAADGALLVIRHGRTRHAEAERAVQTLASVNAKLLGSVLNFAPKKVRRGDGYDGYGYGYGYGDTSTSTYTVPTTPAAPARAAGAPVQPSAPVQPAQVRSAAVQPGPVRPAPVQPVRPAPVQPVRPAPVQPAPVQPAPVQPAPVQPAPVDPVQPAPVNGVRVNGTHVNGAPGYAGGYSGRANGSEYAPPPAAPVNGRGNYPEPFPVPGPDQAYTEQIPEQSYAEQGYPEPADDAFPDPANDDFPVPPRGTAQRSTRSRGGKKPRRLRRS
jgi:tyrosine-protein kinase